MAIKLFELVERNDCRPSPYCWRTRMALAHKRLETEFIPVGFTEKDTLAFSGQSLVPVLVDGETTITDSWRVACYLDEAYPDRPSLFGGDIGKATARVINAWAEHTLLFGLFPMVVLDLFNQTKETDRAYFRESREAAFGGTLENVQAGRELMLPTFRAGLAPLRSALEDRTMGPGDFREQAGLAVAKADATPFLGGASPSYVDYIVFGSFQSERIISNFELLEADDPLWDWRERMLDLYDGYARNAVRAMA